MNTSVDVLAVMARDATAAWNDRRGDREIQEFLGKESNEARAAVAELIERDRVQSMELAHERDKSWRLIQLLAAIEMRCAPDDIVVDGRVMRFVPPDPEFYWRELSNKVRTVKEEMREFFAAEDAAALARVKGA